MSRKRAVDRFLAVAEGAITAAGTLLPLAGGFEAKGDLDKAQRYALRGVKLLRRLLDVIGNEDAALALLERIAGPDAAKPITDEELAAQRDRIVAELTGAE